MISRKERSTRPNATALSFRLRASVPPGRSYQERSVTRTTSIIDPETSDQRTDTYSFKTCPTSDCVYARQLTDKTTHGDTESVRMRLWRLVKMGWVTHGQKRPLRSGGWEIKSRKPTRSQPNHREREATRNHSAKRGGRGNQQPRRDGRIDKTTKVVRHGAQPPAGRWASHDRNSRWDRKLNETVAPCCA
jgi:hypothetical protein